jgi:cell division protein FtsI (penicillin-binding protein 3)
MSIGYELRMTPLQTLTLYNAVANSGVMVKPQFVREVREVGKAVQQFGTEVITSEICSPATLKTVQKMLEGVVEHGTATNIRNDMYSIAGKTGTAQVANEKGDYKVQRLYQASFAGYFPASQPMYSIIVVINNPSKGTYYGASVAAPVFKEIADKIYSSTATTRSYLSYFSKPQGEMAPMSSVLHNDDLEVILQKNGKSAASLDSLGTWVRPTTPEGKLRPRNFATRSGLVPDVTGMTLADALYLLENMDLRVKFSGKGRVTAQSLNPGQKYLPKETIVLQLN